MGKAIRLTVRAGNILQGWYRLIVNGFWTPRIFGSDVASQVTTTKDSPSDTHIRRVPQGRFVCTSGKCCERLFMMVFIWWCDWKPSRLLIVLTSPAVANYWNNVQSGFASDCNQIWQVAVWKLLVFSEFLIIAVARDKMVFSKNYVLKIFFS